MIAAATDKEIGLRAGRVYLDAFYEYASSDGKTYDSLFTEEHPLHLTLALGKRLPATPSMALHMGMHEYRRDTLPVLALCAVPQKKPPQMTEPQAIGEFEASQVKVAARYDRIESYLPTVRIVRLPNSSHDIFESNEADVLGEMNAFINDLPN